MIRATYFHCDRGPCFELTARVAGDLRAFVASLPDDLEADPAWTGGASRAVWSTQKTVTRDELTAALRRAGDATGVDLVIS